MQKHNLAERAGAMVGSKTVYLILVGEGGLQEHLGQGSTSVSRKHPICKAKQHV